MAGAKGFSSSETTSETSAAFPPLVLMMVSAISIEAVERFFSHLPKASGFVFVIIAYGERRSPSTLTDRLRRCVGIPVHDVAENLRVEPDHVYLASPRCELVLQGDRLCPVSRGSEGLRHPADAFLRSLAEQRGEDAFGIVFPGAGDEGAVGLRAIKDQGGVTLAQPPEPAGQDQVLASAIAAGLMDWLLPAADMPAKLLALYRQSGTLRERALANAEIADQLEPICALLQRRTGHDFRSYKQGTLVRRIRRRMLLKQAATIADYLRNLEQDPGEAELAQRDLLIGVTQFFRDPEAFEVLAAQVLPELLEGRPAESPVRIWVPGCATGEEAYSIAMLVLEQLDRIDPSRRVQVFATDIDSEMLARARQGRYPGEIRAQVSDDRLERFFVREGGQVRVGIDLREACIFSGHSLVRDPPFSNLDLVSCRNVLIYFDPSLQKKVVPLLHYALRPGGFLFLGPTEGLAAHAELFSEVSRPHRLFRRNETTSRPRLEFPLIGQVEGRPASPRGSPGTAAIDRQLWVSQAFERMILNEFAPACAVVNERGDLFTSAGPTGLFLQAPAGAPSLNLLDQAQGTLGIELRTALARSARSWREVVRDDLMVKVDGRLRNLRLTVRPMPGLMAEAGLFAVVFQETAPVELDAREDAESRGAERPVVDQLTTELRHTRVDLQAAVEELGGANRELKSANAELVSTNQALQSANEELQTSKEELQSVNEELATVNAELHEKIGELARANADLQNLFASTEIATLFLDGKLRIARFTPAAGALLRLRDGDMGRPLAELAHPFQEQDLSASAEQVLRTGTPFENPIRNGEGRSFILRILPYRTLDQTVAGVSVTLIDVTALQVAEEKARRYGELVHLSQDAILVARLNGEIETWNRGAEELYGYSAEEAIGRTTRELLQTVFPQPWPEIEATLLRRERWEGEVQHRVREGRWVTAAIRLRLARGDDGVERVLESIRDVTERKNAERELRQSEERFRSLFSSMTEGFALHEIICDASGVPCDYRFLEVNSAFERLTGLTRAQVMGKRMRDVLPGEDPIWVERYGRVALTGEPVKFESRSPVLERQYSVYAFRPAPNQFAVLFMDVTERERIQEQLHEADRRKDEFLAVLSHELRNPLTPIRASLFILDRAEPGSDKAQRAKAVIARQVGQLSRLIDDLLDATRISRGKIQLQRTRFDLSNLVRQVLEDYRSLFASRSLEVEPVLSSDSLWVNGDPARIAQALGNLLQNAAKFSSPRGRVRISLEEDPAKRMAVIRVKDEGVGIGPEMMPRLFQPFEQVESTLARTHGGLGLGLALVKGLVEMHGGEATAKSEGLGQGAEFTIRLPLESATDEVPAGRVRPSGGGMRRVLVIEDNVDAADSLREALEMSAHVVEVAYDGSEGLAKARAFGPEIVLCDIGLPGMDGYQVARAFRADATLRSAFLVALSGYAMPADVTRAREAGFNQHVAKPPSLDQLDELFAAVPRQGAIGSPAPGT